MVIIRALAAAAIFTVAIIAGTPAVAECNGNYPSTCTPVAPKEPPETAAESEKASKPLQINSRYRARTAKARSERSAQTQRKRFAKRSGSKTVLALRSRRAKAVATRSRERTKAAEFATEDDAQVTPLPPVRSLRAPRRALASLDASASTGEAPDLTATEPLQPQPVVTVPIAKTVEQARPVPASVPAAGPAPIPGPAPVPVRTTSQDELNEIDLAAAGSPEPADQSWMRTLILAFGGLLAVGSALRLFL
jgi:hypothetical protein